MKGHSVILLFFLFLGKFATAQIDSTNLPILRISTASQIKDEPKVNGTLEVFAEHPSGFNSLDHAPVLDGRIGIEYRGKSSQALFDKKGFGFEFRAADGTDTSRPMLNFPKGTDWVLHGPYSDKSLMRNAIAYQIADEIFDYAPRTVFVELILNNNYHGVYLLTEKIQIKKNRIDLKRGRDSLPPDAFIFKFDKGEWGEVALRSAFPPVLGSDQRTDILFHDPKPTELAHIQEDFADQYLRSFENMLASRHFNDQHRGYPRWIDTESFVDYMLFSEFTHNVDAYRISTYFYKESGFDGGLLHAGPVWDYNIAFGNANYCNGGNTAGWSWDFNTICPEDGLLVHFWWQRFLQDEDFVNHMVSRWEELREDVLSEAKVISRIDSLYDLLQEPQRRNFKRWPVLGKHVWPNLEVFRTYQEEVFYLKRWIVQRLEWMDTHIAILNQHEKDGGVLAYRVFPNPAREAINLHVVTSGNAEVHVRIFDLMGRVINERDFELTGATSHDLSLPAPHQSGTYLVEIGSRGIGLDRKKVVVLDD